MKKSRYGWAVGTAGVLALICGCQTAKYKSDTERNPAFARHRHDDNNGPYTPPPYNPVPVPDQPDSDQASNEIVRITTINGVASTDHGYSIDVHPGDVVSISADVMNMSSGYYNAEGREVEDFIWSANDSESDVCNAADSDDCLDNSNFEVTDYGVNFYVPYNAGPQISISVSDQTSPNAGNDAIVLNNSDQITTTPVIVSSPDSYPCNDFDDDCALAGQGRWVYINGARYFVPYVADANWAPYTHGYWTWVDGDGWTWVSYDQWGWYTDHYGYWRHHSVYGWIWMPFDDHAYRPATVTWFFDDGHVGWYPYYNDWAVNHPYWGEEYGFDDGYWEGFHDGEWYQRWHPGFYVVTYNDFGSDDVWEHSSHDVDPDDVYSGCYQHHSFGSWPGGQDRNSSWQYMHQRAPQVVVTHVDDHHFGRTTMRFPAPVRPVPPAYRIVQNRDQRFGRRPIPVGAVVTQNRIVPPTQNGRGITAPPFVRNNDSGQVAALPPRARRPAQPNSGNPIFHRPPIITQTAKLPPWTPGRGQGPVPTQPSPNRPDRPIRQRPQPPVFNPPVVTPDNTDMQPQRPFPNRPNRPDRPIRQRPQPQPPVFNPPVVTPDNPPRDTTDNGNTDVQPQRPIPNRPDRPMRQRPEPPVFNPPENNPSDNGGFNPVRERPNRPDMNGSDNSGNNGDEGNGGRGRRPHPNRNSDE